MPKERYVPFEFLSSPMGREELLEMIRQSSMSQYRTRTLVPSCLGPSEIIKTVETDNKTLCMTNDEGHKWVHYIDSMPRSVKERIWYSPFNLCPACLQCTLSSWRIPMRDPLNIPEQEYFDKITEWENKLRSAS